MKPLHRSLTLWTGLVILGFLLWSQRDSKSHDTIAYAHLHRLGLAFNSYPGGACPALQTGTWMESESAFYRAVISPGSVAATSYPDNPMRPGYQVISPITTSVAHLDRTYHVLILPYWFLIALWLSLWAAMFIFRHRRARSAATQTSADH